MKRVYIIVSEGGPIKIGISRAPEERVIALANAGFGKLDLAHVSQPTADARKIEKAAHRTLRLGGYAVEGEAEWFSVSLEAARNALDVAQRIIDGRELDLQHAPRVRMKYLQVRLTSEDRALLDEMRRGQPDIPTRAQMMRRCIEAAWEARQKP